MVKVNIKKIYLSIEANKELFNKSTLFEMFAILLYEQL